MDFVLGSILDPTVELPLEAPIGSRLYSILVPSLRLLLGPTIGFLIRSELASPIR